MADDPAHAESDEAPESSEDLRERFRARRRGAVAVLRGLCLLPALGLLYYTVFPKVTYTYQVTLSAPTPARTVALGEVRREPRDRALALVAIDAAGKDRADTPRVVVRNNIRSATIYRRLTELERPSHLRLTLRPPASAGDPVLPLDGWQMDVQTSSDYARQLGHRVWGLGLGLVLVALAALLIPRLVHVLWPDSMKTDHRRASAC